MRISEFLCKEIINNKTNKKIMLVLTGGGAISLSELTKHGGSSNVLECALIPYGQKSLKWILGYTPEKSVSAKTAIDLMGNIKTNIVIVSCTASLRKAGAEREGRIHEAYIGFNDGFGPDVYHVVFNANRTREQEEELLAMIILAGIDQYVNLRKMSILHSIAHTAKTQKEQMGYSHLDWSDKDLIDIVYMRGQSLEVQDKADSN